MKQTGGTWDPSRWPLYFMASEVFTLGEATLHETDNLLVAVNEIVEAKGREGFETLLLRGRKVFLDSGVYSLATQHAKANNISMDQALGLAPEQVSGFDELFRAYVDIVQTYEPGLWGYIEIDQGGRDNKTRTRARLEAMGLRPIPVYHPLNDGWDYFDELASQYDRICLGNVVMARSEERKRLLATLWERRRRYPNLWIHALGVTPSQVSLAYPMNSCDSSTWLSSVRWSALSTSSAAQPMGVAQKGFIYSRGSDANSEGGYVKARRLCAYNAIMMGHTMRNIKADQERELGADAYLLDHGEVSGSRFPPLA